MTLFMIGIGLNNERDISLKGLDAINKSSYVFLENYTSKMNCRVEKLEKLYGKKINPADRDLVEKNSDEILNKALDKNVSFLVAGDVFSATTHVDLFLRAREKGINIRIIHNSSILTAVGIVGLELYKFGKTASLPFFEKSFIPETPYTVIFENKKRGLHTLVLLDIKKDKERFMSVNKGLIQLLELEKKLGKKIILSDSKIIGCARLGSERKVIKYGKVKDLLEFDFGKPLHCIIVPGKLHFMEEKMLEIWK
ncbi:diphthine synthase [Candidatus Woesearchaeota archaeon]|nr:diphthine synthase [Candidatus Woesearchaeota archaeon]